MSCQISMFDLIPTEIPAIGSTVYNVTGCKIKKCTVTGYSTEGCNKYLHGTDEDGTFYRHIGALGKGMFIKRSAAAEYLKNY